MPIPKLKPFILCLAAILAAIGIVLYTASYFVGIPIIICAVILRFALRAAETDRKTVRSELRKLLRNLSVPLLGIASAIVIGAMIMVLTGYNPITAYRALFYGGFVKNWHVSLLNAAPLIFTGLSIDNHTAT